MDCLLLRWVPGVPTAPTRDCLILCDMMVRNQFVHFFYLFCDEIKRILTPLLTRQLWRIPFLSLIKIDVKIVNVTCFIKKYFHISGLCWWPMQVYLQEYQRCCNSRMVIIISKITPLIKPTGNVTNVSQWYTMGTVNAALCKVY
jgi:hypothetical protein